MKKIINRIQESEALATVVGFAVMIGIISWLLFLINIVTGDYDSLWNAASDSILTVLSMVAIALFCGGCVWLTERKNIFLRVVGTVLIFLLFSAVFASCWGVLSLSGRH